MWMVCTIVLAISLARKFAVLSQFIEANHFLTYWLVPIWIIFTTLMLIWAVARFANKYLRHSPSFGVEELSERDVIAVANARFWHHNKYRAFWGLLVLFALIAISSWLDIRFQVKWFGYIVIIIYLGAMIAIYIAVRKNEKEFLDAWKKK